MLSIKRLLLIFLGLGFYLQTQAQLSIEATIDSSSIMIGQQTVIHLKVTQPRNASVQLPVISDNLGDNVIVVEVKGDTIADDANIKLDDDIIITSFVPGEHIIPPFECNENGKTLSTESIKLTVNDVNEQFEEGKLPSDIMGIYDPPYSTFLFIVLGVLLFIILVIGLFTYFYWRRHKEDPEPYIKNNAIVTSKQPATTALELIAKIEEDQIWKTPGNEKKFFTMLTDIIRQYFYRRYKINAMEMTSSELLDAIKKKGVAYVIREKLQVICLTGDMTKFAKHKPTDEECTKCVDLAREIIKMTALAEQIENKESDSKVNDK